MVFAVAETLRLLQGRVVGQDKSGVTYRSTIGHCAGRGPKAGFPHSAYYILGPGSFIEPHIEKRGGGDRRACSAVEYPRCMKGGTVFLILGLRVLLLLPRLVLSLVCLFLLLLLVNIH